PVGPGGHAAARPCSRGRRLAPHGPALLAHLAEHLRRVPVTEAVPAQHADDAVAARLDVEPLQPNPELVQVLADGAEPFRLHPRRDGWALTEGARPLAQRLHLAATVPPSPVATWFMPVDLEDDAANDDVDALRFA